MLIRSFVVLLLIAFPLSMSAVSLDLSKMIGGGASQWSGLNLSDSDPFESHWRWRRHKHTKKKRVIKRPVKRAKKPGAAVPEPSAALLFGLGAVVVGAGIRRRR